MEINNTMIKKETKKTKLILLLHSLNKRGFVLSMVYVQRQHSVWSVDGSLQELHIRSEHCG